MHLHHVGNARTLDIDARARQKFREMDIDDVKEWMTDNGYATCADAFAGNT